MDAIVNSAAAQNGKYDVVRAAIAVEGLVKRYRDVLAVDDISFAVPHGSFTALLGGNGAGKTTTIAMLLGLVLPTAGRITILGDRFRDAREIAPCTDEFPKPLCRSATPPDRAAESEDLCASLRCASRSRNAHRACRARARPRDAARPAAGELSAGQRTRAGLAKAFINRPRIVLLDEPTASLDPDTADWVRGFLSRYAQEAGATFLIARTTCSRSSGFAIGF